MSERDGYRLQVAGDADRASPDLLPAVDCRRGPAGAGWQWISQGFALFMKQPLLWVGVIVLLFIIRVLLSLHPLLLPFSTLLAPVFAGGLVLGARHCDLSANMQIADLFAGFGQRFGRLFLIGLLFLLGMVLIMVLAALVLMFSVGPDNLEMLATAEDVASEQALLVAASGGALISLLVAAALAAPLLMAYWFAPALVVFNPERGALDAMRQSLQACLHNWLPLLVYGLVLLPLFVAASIPMGLGLLILLPVIAASNYAAYKDIFAGG